jgi:hypothetical protein
MCYSKDLSLTSFIFGISVSLSLIYLGNEKSSKTNKTIGYYFFFISFIQLVEYFIWSDIECKSGLNNFASLIGPILNLAQPVVLLILATIFLDSTNIIPTNIIVPINIIYVIYIGYQYCIYLNDPSNHCIKTNECNHLDWTWKNDFDYTYYFAILFINIANFYTNVNFMISVAFSYLLLLISFLQFHKNIGEFWCLLATSVPLVNLFVQKILNINN